jgi:putative flippase GtrA
MVFAASDHLPIPVAETGGPNRLWAVSATGYLARRRLSGVPAGESAAALGRAEVPVGRGDHFRSGPSAPLTGVGGIATSAADRAEVEIVLPVHNEEGDLARAVHRLHAYLVKQFPFRTVVTIADNGSTDRTGEIARSLAARLPAVRLVRIEQPGRGRALAQVWRSSEAEILAYMDVDLSTDLNALLPLVAPLRSGHSDVAIGTRLSLGAHVSRGPKRDLISRAYNLLLHATLGTAFSDAQCGFKAIRCDAARLLLPWVADTGWFFDTELLVLAERAGLRIYEVPVDWTDDPDSRVDILATAWADLRGIQRLGWALARGRVPLPARAAEDRRAPLGRQVVTFLLIGVASTLVYLWLYLGLRDVTTAQAANTAALVTSAVANTAANRRFTFRIRGRRHAARHQIRGLVAFGVGLAVTSGSLLALHAIARQPSHTAEAVVLVAANLVATGARFLLYRGWVFRTAPTARASPQPEGHTCEAPTRSSREERP